MSLRSGDDKKIAGLMPSTAKDQDQAPQQGRRKRKAKGRRRKEEREDRRTHLHRPPEGHAKAFNEAGLPSKGFWSFSNRNKGRRIAQSEAEPDESKLIMLDLRKCLICKHRTGCRAVLGDSPIRQSRPGPHPQGMTNNVFRRVSADE